MPRRLLPTAIAISAVVGIAAVAWRPMPAPRGPYLQSLTSTSVGIRWRTVADTHSHVRIRRASDADGRSIVIDDTEQEHEVRVDGLTPGAAYQYSIDGVVWFEFHAPPERGADVPVRVWVIGDSGKGNDDARQVLKSWDKFSDHSVPDVWLTLGDNAYHDGTDRQYQSAFFEMYPRLLARTSVWPTRGNHDRDPAYFDMFSLPENGAAGGVPSHTESYYAFDYGPAHFIALDSTHGDLEQDGPMLSWLKRDLAANTQPWTIAYWHHAPYSKGTHDSDQTTDEERAMTHMRMNALPILEAAGVDVVYAGHSHCYERSYFVHGHYGTSDTLTGAMMLDNGDGDPAGDGAYRKTGNAPGTVYVVTGNASQVNGGTVLHPVMAVARESLGSVVVDIDGPRLTSTFINEWGNPKDVFVIEKTLP